jgi:hypothetical protein
MLFHGGHNVIQDGIVGYTIDGYAAVSRVSLFRSTKVSMPLATSATCILTFVL